MNEKLRIKLKKLTVIILLWMVAGFCMSAYDHFTLHSYNSMGPAVTYSFARNVVFNVMAAVLGGVMGGSFLVFYINEKFRSKPYGITILAVCISFLCVMVIISLLIGSLRVAVTENASFSEAATQHAFAMYILDPIHLKNIFFWSFIVGLTQFILQINDKFGQGNLWSFIRGKYHEPKEELRIFMMADLRSSTSVAERLGNKHYHQLLQDLYADITDAILTARGMIYQYVGDEVVISWDLAHGIENNNCLKCCFGIRQAILDRSHKYLRKYGFIPEFKAGLHYGVVMAGEVGVIKREITFSGDILNTTARIQEQCNIHEADVILTDELLALLARPDNLHYKALGNVVLKGKTKAIGLVAVAY